MFDSMENGDADPAPTPVEAGLVRPASVERSGSVRGRVGGRRGAQDRVHSAAAQDYGV